ncbi:MAG: ABC transporter permease [Pseudoflavonifractor sp.]|nr:ABC transporter permease [Pseudoflavonifractor sp.]
MLDLIREIAQTLRNNKLRTALTGFAVAWGIFMLIVLLGMSRGVFNSFSDSRMSQGFNSIDVWGGTTSKSYGGFKEGRAIALKDADLGAIESRDRRHVDEASPRLSGETGVISSPHDYISASYSGVYPNALSRSGEEISEGRFINANDISNRRKVVVMSRKNAAILYPGRKEFVGQRVNLQGLSFTIVGIYDSEWRQTTYIPYSTARTLKGDDSTVDQISVMIKDVETMEDGEAVERGVRGTLASRHSFDPDDNSAVWIWNRFTQHLTMNAGMGILDIAVWVIGIFTMLSGIVGVSNIMFVSVRERTHEIGIRRAIGAKPRNILTQIILESVSITALFGYIGIFFGILVTELLAAAFESSDFIKNPTVDISIALKVTAVLIVAGAIAGIFPALKALKVKPVEALRTE